MSRRAGRLGAVLFHTALALMLASGIAGAAPRHGLSAFGDLKYPPDFTHFAYVNTAAPKGGSFSLVGWGGTTTFNSLNNYILKGDAAQGLELLFDSLMARAEDEPDAVYGLVAKSADLSADGKSVTFELRPEALCRRLAAHRRGRRLFLRGAEGKGPPDLPRDPARRSRGRGAGAA